MALGIENKRGSLSVDKVVQFIKEVFSQEILDNKRVLVITPDASRSCPLGMIFRAIHQELSSRVAALDVLIALGTHAAMSEKQINKRFNMSSQDRKVKFKNVKFINHVWDDPKQLHSLGSITSAEIDQLTEGLFSMDVNITINRLVLDYDLLLVVGPVFPHEVVGFSGGNKYFFPGISGREIIDFFHWLGAVITNPKIIGTKYTPVRAVLDQAAKMIPTVRRALTMVVTGNDLHGLYYGTPEAAWSDAADLSNQQHIIYKDKSFHTVLSCAPEMYDELWTGAKCMYKLEPVVADGGELIIYAPHIKDIAVVHDEVIRKLGYHTRDYFLKQWERFKTYPWGIIAHSTHVCGIGSYEDGIEIPRIKVTLATGISEEICHAINLGYQDPATITLENYANREEEGILLVPNAGEQLYKLIDPPAWGRFD